MKYLIRLIAAIPALGVGISCVYLFILMFDYHFLVLALIGNLIGFIYLLDKLEDIVEDVEEIYNIIIGRYDPEKIPNNK